MNRLLCLLLAVPLFATAQDRPNIVFLIADDLGWADVAFNGGNVPTPNLDRLKAEGVELTQHTVAPICSPTRASLLTGRYWSRFGVTTPTNEQALPLETVTLASALKECGYETCLSGKWHLGSMPEWGPNQFGFDHSYGSLAGGVGPYNHLYKKGPYSVTWHRNGELLTDEGHVTDLITDEAVKWIGERGENPFFLYVPFTAVHLPLKEPQVWLDQVPPAISGEVARHYAASILHLDAAVGRIVAAVEEAGKASNTIIVFTSDNGGSTVENNDTKYPGDVYPSGRLTGNNAPLRGRKGDIYEGGIRVPTVVRWEGKLNPGSVCETPLHISDWMPTFCALAGYEKGDSLNWDGADVWGAVSGDVDLPERALYSAGPSFRAVALRKEAWKLVVHPGKEGAGERAELYHLAEDIGESRDLAKVMPEKLAELRADLEKARASDLDAVVPRG